ncbi:S1 family peptidase [Actinokineospora enzanensis]|uniref:S1 family peptidase n=1 Tax=Actinokineospora enzanensis TaxID=155975 RepID=UPI000377B838|nr:S1 family peptidase [Actinokineospora enzanensis]
MRFRAILCALVLCVVTAPAASATVTLVGGDSVIVGGKRCVIGFNARTGSGARVIITTGACAGTSGPIGIIPAPPDSVSTPLVRVGSGTTTVHGATEAAIGSSVCAYGPASGWRCGTVQARNQTVNYPTGTITGLTRTTLCVEPGDAGGPVLSGNGQAQGILIGGSGNCRTGGVGYFAPVRPALSAYGLILYTG